jgi:hypothetical protein
MVLLDIDMPKSCKECPLSKSISNPCVITEKHYLGVYDKMRGYDCPILCKVDEDVLKVARSNEEATKMYDEVVNLIEEDIGSLDDSLKFFLEKVEGARNVLDNVI